MRDLHFLSLHIAVISSLLSFSRLSGIVVLALVSSAASAQDLSNELLWLKPTEAPSARLPKDPIVRGGSMPAGAVEEKLIEAAREGGIKQVKELLAEGARPNAQSTSGARALNEAVAGGHWEIARLLIKQGADPNASDNHGRSPLDTAVFYRRDKLVSLLVRQGSELEKRNALGNTPLVTALLLSREDEARQLISAGARIDIKSGDKRCIAELAAIYGSEALVDLVMSEGGQAACR